MFQVELKRYKSSLWWSNTTLGIDKSDQLSYYEYTYHTVKWWRQDFFTLLTLQLSMCTFCIDFPSSLVEGSITNTFELSLQNNCLEVLMATLILPQCSTSVSLAHRTTFPQDGPTMYMWEAFTTCMHCVF